MKLHDMQEHVASIDLQVVIDDRGDFFLGQQLAVFLVQVVADKHLKRSGARLRLAWERRQPVRQRKFQGRLQGV